MAVEKVVPLPTGTAFCGELIRYHQPVIFPAQQVSDTPAPHGHDVAGIKRVVFPGIVVRHAAGGGGQVNVGMSLLVASPGVDNGKAAGQKAAATPGFQDNVCREAAHFRQQPAIMVYQQPEFTGKGKSDVLPFAVGDEGQQILYPDFTGFDAAVRAGTGFTAEADFFV